MLPLVAFRICLGEFRFAYETYHTSILFLERYANVFYFSVRVSSSHDIQWKKIPKFSHHHWPATQRSATTRERNASVGDWPVSREGDCVQTERDLTDRCLRWSYIHCCTNKMLSCRGETARCFVSLNISWSHLRSLKIIETGTIQKLGYGFLFAFHNNYGFILHRFQYTAGYWSTSAIFSYFPCIRRPR